MIKGIGTDIVKISRIKVSNKSFLSLEENKIFDNLNEVKKQEFLAGRWAAKEAIFKAWNNCPRDFKKISILYNKNNQPYVNDYPEILISISHDGEYALAFAIYIENN